MSSPDLTAHFCFVFSCSVLNWISRATLTPSCGHIPPMERKATKKLPNSSKLKFLIRSEAALNTSRHQETSSFLPSSFLPNFLHFPFLPFFLPSLPSPPFFLPFFFHPSFLSFLLPSFYDSFLLPHSTSSLLTGLLSWSSFLSPTLPSIGPSFLPPSVHPSFLLFIIPSLCHTPLPHWSTFLVVLPPSLLSLTLLFFAGLLTHTKMKEAKHLLFSWMNQLKMSAHHNDRQTDRE